MFYLYYKGSEDEPIEEVDTLPEAKAKAAALAGRERTTIDIVGAVTGETVYSMTPERADAFKGEIRRLFRAMEAE